MGLSREQKQKVLQEEDFCCHYCCEAATTVDHKIARIEGGTDARENLVAACVPCNEAKGRLPYETYLRFTSLYGRPDGYRWYRGTNNFVDKAVANIASRVSLERTADIVLEKFADGNAHLAARFLRRGLFRMGLEVDVDLVESILFIERNEQMSAAAL